MPAKSPTARPRPRPARTALAGRRLAQRPSTAELREAIAASLKITDARIIADVMEDFRGAYGSDMEYIRRQLQEYLPPWSAWLLECCDNDRLRRGYEAGKLLVWTLPHPRDPRKLLIFESPRAKFRTSPE